MSELNSFVASRLGVYFAPDSPGRILRLMMQAGAIHYEVVNRKDSKYRIIPKPFIPNTQTEMFSFDQHGMSL
jgi:hypothetical protein